jgi:diguanylate cyclase (GGDEF)-like protein
MSGKHSLASRTLRLATIRIGIVALSAGALSYLINLSSIEQAVRAQLMLSTEQTIQRESLPFREIRELEENFLDDFRTVDRDARLRAGLVRDFDLIFTRRADGSYVQRPGLFEGAALADGRRFPGMSATYAPDNPPGDDVKARFALSYLLSFKYGSATRGRLFNFYGVVPEKGFPIHQDADISKVFTYEGPDALRLETYEFYARGFAATKRETFLTRMYYDYSNKAWMTTMATSDTPDADGRHRILACVDILLDSLLHRLARPAVAGAYSTLFLADENGTLMFHPDHMDEIRKGEGSASIHSLGLQGDLPPLAVARSLPPGKVMLFDTADSISALGRIPETEAILAVHYPKTLMRPAILQNLAVVAAVGLLTLLVEIVIIRSILLHQVARPLARLIDAARRLGAPDAERVDGHDLPITSRDEIGDLARDFVAMAERVQDARDQLEGKVRERTRELESANRKLAAMSTTDALTGIANRRRFDEMLDEEWRRARRAGARLMVAKLDVDHFKAYNDRHGHQAGDQCLQAIGHTLAAGAHRAGDHVARYGGEEFVVILSATEAEDGAAFMESIRAEVERLDIRHEDSPHGVVTVSIGLADTIPDDDQLPQDLLRRADIALYRAKELGRNRVETAE